MLELHDLTCERDERVLFCGLSLKVEAGDLIQIEGPNGSGKTTLLRVLTGLSGEYRGQLSWQGQPLAQARLDYLSQMLYVGHLPGVKKALTPRENLAWYAGMSGGQPRCSVEEALAEVGLFGYEDRPCYQLSAGQARRVALARLFLTPARLWILDEPFTAIDVQGVENLQRLMQEHVRGGGAVVLTTHQRLTIEPVRYVNLMSYRKGVSEGL